MTTMRPPSPIATYLLRVAHSVVPLWPIGFLALIAIAFFWPMVLAGRWIPHGGGDLVSFLWPQYSFAAQSIRSGSMPLWNPHLYSGVPLLADNQSGVLYPINLLAFWLFPNFTYQVMEGLVVFHIWLAGVAMYTALRIWPLGSVIQTDRIGYLPALFGAVAYMLNDVFVTHIGNLNLIAAAAWLPLACGLFARGLSDRRAGWSAAAGVTFAIALLAGHAQMTVITLIGLGAIAGWQVIVTSGWRERVRVSGLSAVTLLVAFGLTAVQLLPSLEMTRYSLRAGLSYEGATAYSLPPTALASIFSPLLFGRGPANFWGPWQRVETGYLGVIPVLLMGLAFVRRRSNSAWFLAAFGMLGLLIALGKFAPVYVLVHAAPVLGGLRVPARFILLTDFAVAALGALGLNRLITERVSVRRIFYWNGLVLTIGLISLGAAYQSVQVAGRDNNLSLALIAFGVIASIAAWVMIWGAQSAARGRRSAILLISLAAIELIALGSTVEIDANDPTAGFDHPGILEYLRSDPNTYRIENTSSAWQPDAALMHGLNDIGGLFNPLSLASYETYRGGMGYRGSPLYNFLGVKYVLAPKNEPPADASFVPVFSADPSIDVYLNTHALPRAQLIDRTKVVTSGEEAWQAIHAPDFDPSSMVVIQGGKNLSGPNLAGLRSLAFGRVSNDRVELDVQTPTPTYLVLSDVYYPGWVATIDDKPVDLLPADFAFRTVPIPTGSHHVRFQFEPISWRWGQAISAVTIAGLVLWVGLRRGRR